jgi:hypothetical protein
MSANEEAAGIAARRRLTQCLDESCAEQGLDLQDIAERSGIAVATLRRIRNKPESTLTTKAKRAIENGMLWLNGDVDRILRGGTYTYRAGVVLPGQNARPLLDPRTSSLEQILQFLITLKTEQPTVFQEVRTAVLDINRFKPTD